MRPNQRFLLLSAACALAFSTAAPAQGARSTYAQDRAFCNSGQSSQDRATCLREAGAAAQEASKGNLSEASEQTKFARCDYHKNPEDREYCIRRMRGEGTVSGSVDGGGLMRELTVTIKPGQ